MVDLTALVSVFVALLFFLMIVVGGVFFWILNYHFERFGLIGDKWGKLFVYLYGISWLGLTLAGFGIIFFI